MTELLADKSAQLEMHFFEGDTSNIQQGTARASDARPLSPLDDSRSHRIEMIRPIDAPSLSVLHHRNVAVASAKTSALKSSIAANSIAAKSHMQQQLFKQQSASILTAEIARNAESEEAKKAEIDAAAPFINEKRQKSSRIRAADVAISAVTETAADNSHTDDSTMNKNNHSKSSNSDRISKHPSLLSPQPKASKSKSKLARNDNGHSLRRTSSIESTKTKADPTEATAQEQLLQQQQQQQQQQQHLLEQQQQQQLLQNLPLNSVINNHDRNTFLTTVELDDDFEEHVAASAAAVESDWTEAATDALHGSGPVAAAAVDSLEAFIDSAIGMVASSMGNMPIDGSTVNESIILSGKLTKSTTAIATTAAKASKSNRQKKINAAIAPISEKNKTAIGPSPAQTAAAASAIAAAASHGHRQLKLVKKFAQPQQSLLQSLTAALSHTPLVHDYIGAAQQQPQLYKLVKQLRGCMVAMRQQQAELLQVLAERGLLLLNKSRSNGAQLDHSLKLSGSRGQSHTSNNPAAAAALATPVDDFGNSISSQHGNIQVISSYLSSNGELMPCSWFDVASDTDMLDEFVEQQKYLVYHARAAAPVSTTPAATASRAAAATSSSSSSTASTASLLEASSSEVDFINVALTAVSSSNVYNGSNDHNNISYPGHTATQFYLPQGSLHSNVSYMQQGDVSMYTLSAMLQRQVIKFDVELLLVIEQWWAVCTKQSYSNDNNSSGSNSTIHSSFNMPTIDKDEYVHVFLLVRYVLIDSSMHSDNEQVKQQLEAEWQIDVDYSNNISSIAAVPASSVIITTSSSVKNKIKGMSFASFHKALFTLADQWTFTATAEEYIRFLSALLTAVSFDVKSSSSNSSNASKSQEERQWKMIPFAFDMRDEGFQDVFYCLNEEELLVVNERENCQQKQQQERWLLEQQQQQYGSVLATASKKQAALLQQQQHLLAQQQQAALLVRQLKERQQLESKLLKEKRRKSLAPAYEITDIIIEEMIFGEAFFPAAVDDSVISNAQHFTEDDDLTQTAVASAVNTIDSVVADASDVASADNDIDSDEEIDADLEAIKHHKKSRISAYADMHKNRHNSANIENSSSNSDCIISSASDSEPEDKHEARKLRLKETKAQLSDDHEQQQQQQQFINGNIDKNIDQSQKSQQLLTQRHQIKASNKNSFTVDDDIPAAEAAEILLLEQEQLRKATHRALMEASAAKRAAMASRDKALYATVAVVDHAATCAANAAAALTRAEQRAAAVSATAKKKSESRQKWRDAAKRASTHSVDDIERKSDSSDSSDSEYKRNHQQQSNRRNNDNCDSDNASKLSSRMRQKPSQLSNAESGNNNSHGQSEGNISGSSSSRSGNDSAASHSRRRKQQRRKQRKEEYSRNNERGSSSSSSKSDRSQRRHHLSESSSSSESGKSSSYNNYSNRTKSKNSSNDDDEDDNGIHRVQSAEERAAASREMSTTFLRRLATARAENFNNSVMNGTGAASAASGRRDLRKANTESVATVGEHQEYNQVTQGADEAAITGADSHHYQNKSHQLEEPESNNKHNKSNGGSSSSHPLKTQKHRSHRNKRQNHNSRSQHIDFHEQQSSDKDKSGKRSEESNNHSGDDSSKTSRSTSRNSSRVNKYDNAKLLDRDSGSNKNSSNDKQSMPKSKGSNTTEHGSSNSNNNTINNINNNNSIDDDYNDNGKNYNNNINIQSDGIKARSTISNDSNSLNNDTSNSSIGGKSNSSRQHRHHPKRRHNNNDSNKQQLQEQQQNAKLSVQSVMLLNEDMFNMSSTFTNIKQDKFGMDIERVSSSSNTDNNDSNQNQNISRNHNHNYLQDASAIVHQHHIDKHNSSSHKYIKHTKQQKQHKKMQHQSPLDEENRYRHNQQQQASLPISTPREAAANDYEDGNFAYSSPLQPAAASSAAETSATLSLPTIPSGFMSFSSSVTLHPQATSKSPINSCNSSRLNTNNNNNNNNSNNSNNDNNDNNNNDNNNNNNSNNNNRNNNSSNSTNYSRNNDNSDNNDSKNKNISGNSTHNNSQQDNKYFDENDYHHFNQQSDSNTIDLSINNKHNAQRIKRQHSSDTDSFKHSNNLINSNREHSFSKINNNSSNSDGQHKHILHQQRERKVLVVEKWGPWMIDDNDTNDILNSNKSNINDHRQRSDCDSNDDDNNDDDQRSNNYSNNNSKDKSKNMQSDSKSQSSKSIHNSSNNNYTSNTSIDALNQQDHDNSLKTKRSNNNNGSITSSDTHLNVKLPNSISDNTASNNNNIRDNSNHLPRIAAPRSNTNSGNNSSSSNNNRAVNIINFNGIESHSSSHSSKINDSNNQKSSAGSHTVTLPNIINYSTSISGRSSNNNMSYSNNKSTDDVIGSMGSHRYDSSGSASCNSTVSIIHQQTKHMQPSQNSAIIGCTNSSSQNNNQYRQLVNSTIINVLTQVQDDSGNNNQEISDSLNSSGSTSGLLNVMHSASNIKNSNSNKDSSSNNNSDSIIVGNIGSSSVATTLATAGLRSRSDSVVSPYKQTHTSVSTDGDDSSDSSHNTIFVAEHALVVTVSSLQLGEQHSFSQQQLQLHHQLQLQYEQMQQPPQVHSSQPFIHQPLLQQQVRSQHPPKVPSLLQQQHRVNASALLANSMIISNGTHSHSFTNILLSEQQQQSLQTISAHSLKYTRRHSFDNQAGAAARAAAAAAAENDIFRTVIKNSRDP